MRTVALASAVPFSVGVVSLVGLPLITGPVTEPTSSTTDEITGAVGAVASTLTTKAAVGPLVFPAASVAVMVSGCSPSLSAGVGVKDHAPPVAVTVPISTPLSKIFTVEPASAVPERVGCASLVS
ncbi:hypothetical protein D3C71_1138030 [compost metagenome]